MAPHFDVYASHSHLKWSRNIEPILRIKSGAEVAFNLPDCSFNHVRPDNADTALSTFDLSTADPAFGPIYIEGAEPGDVLRIDVLDLETGHYGWTANLSGFGLLADEFPDQTLLMYDLSPENHKQGWAPFPSKTGKGGNIRVPLRPFLGICGLAPAEGELGMIPPTETGGNIDCRHATAVGSTLYLPVKVPGALFSAGDGHAAQGDGEVCGTAIETPMKAKLRFTVEKNMPWVKSPHCISPPEGTAVATGQHYMAMGVDPSPLEATRKALRSAIDWLVQAKGMQRYEAYMLCSVAAHLKMSEVVDMPNYGVVCAVPLGLFCEQ